MNDLATVASPPAAAGGASTPAPNTTPTAPPPAATESRRARVGRLAGRVTLGVGAFAALFVAYELAITPLTEQNAQASLLNQFQQTITTTSVDAPRLTPVEGSPVALMDIPAIGLTQVVVEGTTPSDLKTGPGHLMDTPPPGEAGNVVIAGRRTTYGSPFAKLGNLAKGNIVKVDTGQGSATY